MEAVDGWPEGVLNLVNHPLRTHGWQGFFSECQNDSQYFGIEIMSPADMHRAIKAFATIESKDLVIQLNPGGLRQACRRNRGPLHAWKSEGHRRVVRAPAGPENSERRFGIHSFQKPPPAQPPTLFLYVGHRAVDLRKLRIPSQVKLAAPLSAVWKKKIPAECGAIEAFVETVKPAKPPK